MKSKVSLKCNECGKTWKVSPMAADPRCPKCGGVDWDVVSAFAYLNASKEAG